MVALGETAALGAALPPGALKPPSGSCPGPTSTGAPGCQTGAGGSPRTSKSWLNGVTGAPTIGPGLIAPTVNVAAAVSPVGSLQSVPASFIPIATIVWAPSAVPAGMTTSVAN